VLLQDAQIQRPKRQFLKSGPNQEYARRFGPRHPISQGYEVVVGFGSDDLRFHFAGL
jgi:hypothetical protein